MGLSQSRGASSRCGSLPTSSTIGPGPAVRPNHSLNRTARRRRWRAVRPRPVSLVPCASRMIPPARDRSGSVSRVCTGHLLAGAKMLRSALLTLSFVFSICLVTFAPVAEAQPVGKVYRVGVLGIPTSAHLAEEMGVFRQALREHGWVNERAITFEERYADGHYERLPQLAADLVALKVDVIFAAGGTPAAEAAIKATREIPIVFSNVGDPVAQKMVQSLGHP